jgi:hypothetical protein
VSARRAVALLLVALAVYFAIIGYRGADLVQQHAVGLRVLGVAVFVLPLIGVWAVVAELRFGLASQRLAERLDDEGDEPPDLPRTPAGRVDRAAADAWFARCREQAEAAPDDWRSWYRLAEAYDLAGDRKRARAAMRTAIATAAQNVSR